MTSVAEAPRTWSAEVDSDFGWDTAEAFRIREEWLAGQRSRFGDSDDEGIPFRFGSWTRWEMLWPMLPLLQEQLDVTILFGSDESGSRTPPEWWRAQSRVDFDAEPRTVIIAGDGYLYSSIGAERQMVDPDAFLTTVRDRVIETPALDAGLTWSRPIMPDESLDVNRKLGSIGPNVVSLAWWWRTDSTAADQLSLLYDALASAIERALDPSLAETYEMLTAERIEQQLYEIIKGRGTRERRELEAKVPHLVSSSAEAEQLIRTNEQRLTEIRAQLKAMGEAEIADEELASVVVAELAELRKHEDIVSIDSMASASEESATLTVTTRDLPLVNIDDGESTIGGSYRIDVNFAYDSARVRVTNLTRRIGSYDHPHISDGNFCFGDQRRLVDGLVERGQISAAVSVIVDLLKQVNPDDVYTQEWEAWFQLPESEV